MKRQQSGFTLVEIAIVLVIIGLLLGGVLKGQELINSARAKSVINDFRNTATMIAAYQDRFRVLPGDDPAAAQHLTGALPAANGGLGNGVIEGRWDATAPLNSESLLLWQHLRLANLATGNTAAPAAATVEAWVPRNAEGGRIGVTTAAGLPDPNAPITGRLFICQNQISGRIAQQVDATMDNDVPNTGSVGVFDFTTGALVAAPLAEGTLYIVCAGY